MPQVGDTRKGTDIGYTRAHKYVWSVCINCGKERWVEKKRTERRQFSSLCFQCAHKLGGWGKSGIGGKQLHGRGYWYIKLEPDDFFYPMVDKNGCVLEHRLVVAKALCRNLHRWEVVHHKGAKYLKGSREDKQDNRYPENLQLVTDERHTQITLMERRIKYLEELLAKNGVRF